MHYFLSGRVVEHRKSRGRNDRRKQRRSEKQMVTELLAGELPRERGMVSPRRQRPWRKRTLVQAML